MKKITLFALVALLLTACAPKSYTEFENDLNAFREEVGNVGLGVAVVKENKLIYDNYFGVKNLETGEKIEDVYKRQEASKAPYISVSRVSIFSSAPSIFSSYCLSSGVI